MTLADDVVRLGERFDLDWRAITASVEARLPPDRPADPTWLDPAREPTAWCVPVLLGDYFGVPSAAVRADTEAYLDAYATRQLMFHGTDVRADGPDTELLAEAFRGCRRDALSGTDFAVRFAAKCRPWTVVLGLGTERLRAEAPDPDFQQVMSAVVDVYSSLQIVDDWHDQAEDAARGHWNLWVDEPRPRTLSVIRPLLERGQQAVDRLRPHLLQRALAAQLADTRVDLTAIVTELTGSA